MENNEPRLQDIRVKLENLNARLDNIIKNIYVLHKENHDTSISNNKSINSIGLLAEFKQVLVFDSNTKNYDFVLNLT
jgi:hypothetical protein